MSGSSLDGLDLAFVEFEEVAGKWTFTVKAAHCQSYTPAWTEKLQAATQLSAYDYQLLHTAYGKYIGEMINQFIAANALDHQVQLIASHGHTTFHAPQLGMTAQLGDGAAIAAHTQINVVSDLRTLDVAFGGQGAPIVPVGEKLLWSNYACCLNIGGIANLSYQKDKNYIAFDVCPANRVLNMLANTINLDFDAEGKLAASGIVDEALLTRLNAVDYYNLPFPKSLANSFGVNKIFPIIQDFDLSIADKLSTYTRHIAMQIAQGLQNVHPANTMVNMLVTGGGTFNTFLIQNIAGLVKPMGIEVIVPDEQVVKYKEAVVMALIGVLRWREEYNVLSSVTGASRSSIGGAVWIGQEA